MKCVVCKLAETRQGVATITLEREESIFVVKEVPAQVCPNCGEEYVDSEVTAALLRTTDELSRAGKKLDVRRYASAA